MAGFRRDVATHYFSFPQLEYFLGSGLNAFSISQLICINAFEESSRRHHLTPTQLSSIPDLISFLSSRHKQRCWKLSSLRHPQDPAELRRCPSVEAGLDASASSSAVFARCGSGHWWGVAALSARGAPGGVGLGCRHGHGSGWF